MLKFAIICFLIQLATGLKETEERRQPIPITPERRSAQQIERDNQRQRNFEARRTASQPQLSHDDDTIQHDNFDSKPQPQAARRGSYGNIMESVSAQIVATEAEKDSDDGGFLKRRNSREKQLDEKKQDIRSEEENPTKLVETLQGPSRKKLEGEIGKIEGVYNVGQRYNKTIDDKKNPTGSAASSDYDKAGQSSSNADSGRGSAANSSGRRPTSIDANGEICDTGQRQTNHYRDQHDPEWVDIVENELRQILEPKLHELTFQESSGAIANSTLSESISSMTPPLPPLSPGDQSSPTMTPQNSTRYKHSSLPYGLKPDLEYKSIKSHANHMNRDLRWHNFPNQKHKSAKRNEHSSVLRSKPRKQSLILLSNVI